MSNKATVHTGDSAVKVTMKSYSTSQEMIPVNFNNNVDGMLIVLNCTNILLDLLDNNDETKYLKDIYIEKIKSEIDNCILKSHTPIYICTDKRVESMDISSIPGYFSVENDTEFISRNEISDFCKRLKEYGNLKYIKVIGVVKKEDIVYLISKLKEISSLEELDVNNTCLKIQD